MNQIPKLPTNFEVLSQINEGTNPTFWVQNEQNQQFILKVLPSEVEAQNEFKVLQFLQENTRNIGKSLKTNFENKKTILTPKPILTIRNNLIFEPISGIMLDDNLELTNGLEKEKAFEILKKALRLLKQVHQIPRNEINKLKNLQNWPSKTAKIMEKIEILKSQNPAIIKKIKIGQNWTKLSQSLKSNLLDDLQNEQSLCHGDFSLSHIYYQNRLRNPQNDKNNPISKIKNNDLKNLQFSGIIDFGDASLASPYLDIAHFILKEINKSFGTDLGEFVLRTYFENEKIDYDLLTYFGTFYTIIRLFEFRENEKLFAKFGEKYEFFLEFIKEIKTKQILQEDSKQNYKKYLVFDFDGVLLDGLFSDISTDIYYDLQDKKFSNAFESVLNFWQYFEKPTHQKGQISKVKFQEMKIERIKIGQRRLELDPKLFEEFMVIIAQNKDKFAGFSIVSSSCSNFIKITLGKKIKLFDQILGFDHSHSKEEKINQIVQTLDLKLEQIIYVTDTTTDILELSLLPKNNLFGVNWGYQGNTKLGELLPKSQLLWNFEEFKKLVEI